MSRKPSPADKASKSKNVAYIRSKLEEMESTAEVKANPRLADMIRAALNEARRVEDSLRDASATLPNGADHDEDS